MPTLDDGSLRLLVTFERRLSAGTDAVCQERTMCTPSAGANPPVHKQNGRAESAL